MKSWTSLLINPEALELYDTPPLLENVELLECRFWQGLSTLDFAISLSELPPRRARSWPTDMNAVLLTLQFWNVLTCSLSQSQSTSSNLMVSCTFRKGTDGFLFDCSGKHLTLRAECNYLRVTHLNGYICGSESEAD